MERITLYFAIAVDGEEGRLAVCVTDKAYWEANRFVDDGSGPLHDKICNAMTTYGAEELAGSVYLVNDLDSLIAAMATRGFDLIQDAAFTAYLNRA